MKDKLKELQEKLNRLPLIPLTPKLRKKRDSLAKELLSLAQQQGRVSEVNLSGGTKNENI